MHTFFHVASAAFLGFWAFMSAVAGLDFAQQDESHKAQTALVVALLALALAIGLVTS